MATAGQWSAIGASVKVNVSTLGIPSDTNSCSVTDRKGEGVRIVSVEHALRRASLGRAINQDAYELRMTADHKLAMAGGGGSTNVLLFLRASNLLDEDARQHASALKEHCTVARPIISSGRKSGVLIDKLETRLEEARNCSPRTLVTTAQSDCSRSADLGHRSGELSRGPVRSSHFCARCTHTHAQHVALGQRAYTASARCGAKDAAPHVRVSNNP